LSPYKYKLNCAHLNLKTTCGFTTTWNFLFLTPLNYTSVGKNKY
jgi:hypothetical protein